MGQEVSWVELALKELAFEIQGRSKFTNIFNYSYGPIEVLRNFGFYFRVSKAGIIIFMVILKFAILSDLHAGGNAPSFPERGYSQIVYATYFMDNGLIEPGLGYERKFFKNQSFCLRGYSYIGILGNGESGYANQKMYIYNIGTGWRFYFNPTQHLNGWFLEGVVNLRSTHIIVTNEPVEVDLNYYGLGFIGGYQWITKRHLVFTAGTGARDYIRIGDQSEEILSLHSSDNSKSGGELDLYITIGWAF